MTESKVEPSDTSPAGDLIERTVDLGPRAFRLISVRSINALVDAMGPDDFGPDERLPYWAALWPASVAMAGELLKESDLRGPVLELGCGLGLGSLAAASLGFDVLATDHEPEALELLERNAALNEVELRTTLYDWREPIDVGKFETILAADVLYESRKVIPLVDTIARHLAEDGVAWVADPGRGNLPLFELEAADRGLIGDTLEVGDTEILCLKWQA